MGLRRRPADPEDRPAPGRILVVKVIGFRGNEVVRVMKLDTGEMNYGD
jgi:hypothetical protein